MTFMPAKYQASSDGSIAGPAGRGAGLEPGDLAGGGIEYRYHAVLLPHLPPCRCVAGRRSPFLSRLSTERLVYLLEFKFPAGLAAGVQRAIRQQDICDCLFSVAGHGGHIGGQRDRLEERHPLRIVNPKFFSFCSQHRPRPGASAMQPHCCNPGMNSTLFSPGL